MRYPKEEMFMREAVGRKLHPRQKKSVPVATDEEMIVHLQGMQARHGKYVLEPFERRVLARLLGEAASAAA